MSSLPFPLALVCVLGLASCAAPTPKRQAFPALDKQIEAQVKAGREVVYPALIKSVKPEFPALPAESSVWAVLHVSETGKVREVKTVGDTPLLYQSAIQKALLQWQFHPGSVDGQPSHFPMQVKVTFSMGKDRQSIEAAKAKEGLAINLNDWVIQSAFPELTRKLQQLREQGKKVVPPKVVKKATDVRHPDPRKTGTIPTAFIVDEKGRPTNIHILGEVPKAFQETVANAILTMELQPATVDGSPHPYPAALRFTFRTRGAR